jgi:hypothetical protein
MMIDEDAVGRFFVLLTRFAPRRTRWFICTDVNVLSLSYA